MAPSNMSEDIIRNSLNQIDNDEIALLVKELSKSGIQSYFVEVQEKSENALRALSRLGEVREWRSLGMLVDTTCHYSKMLLDLAFQYNVFDSMHFWLILHDHLALINGNERKANKTEYNLDQITLKEINRTFSNVQMLINSEVTFVIKSSVDLTKITKPQLFTEMHDLKLKHIDTWTKINYIIVEHMSLDLNFKLILQQFDNWGYQTNGSFDGLVGALQRQELDLGATGMLFKEDRLLVMDYVGETYKFRASILFRQPSLASITNIFLLPFSTGVWLCALLMLAITVVALTLEMKVEGKYQRKKRRGKRRKSKSRKDAIHFGEVVMMVVGAACQQGFDSPPSSLSARTTFLALWLASLFLFTSYAANVVALLQTPSHLVQSLADLLKAPLEVGIEDAIYNHVYFRETTDPLTRELYHKKIEPNHERAYYNAIDGMGKVKKGLFAFQVEHAIGYKIISETFTEEEKCGLGNVQLLRMPTLGLPIVRDSPYKEILSQKLRHLREVGVLDRTWKQWVPQKFS
ncbi:ionotropic receptor 75a-like [Hetaerina americana]|uniref:ionotropic receptor 75a-like n=1 Tax=Hetaerina americana TaxID=62018 RepID=UPI003A7F39EA